MVGRTAGQIKRRQAVHCNEAVQSHLVARLVVSRRTFLEIKVADCALHHLRAIYGIHF